MEKKIKAGDRPLTARIIYGVVIAILCITAIVVGIVAAANKKDATDEPPSVNDGTGDGTPTPDEQPDETPKREALEFVMPVEDGEVYTPHCTDTPVFSDTLGEWRLHTGIDIMTAEGAEVFAAEDGEITAIYNDELLGGTVEITHADGIKTVYSNLKKEDVLPVSVGDEVKKGDRIGTVGDTAISEIADEAHLHLEIFVDGVSKDPLDYISQ